MAGALEEPMEAFTSGIGREREKRKAPPAKKSKRGQPPKKS
jgi:hypothetical protein